MFQKFYRHPVDTLFLFEKEIFVPHKKREKLSITQMSKDTSTFSLIYKVG